MGKILRLSSQDKFVQRLQDRVQKEYKARLLAEENLEKTRERFLITAKSANDGLWDWDIQSNTIYFSSRWKEILGYAEQDVPEAVEFWFNNVHKKDVDLLKSAIEKHIQKPESPIHCVYRMKNKEGEYRWMLTRGSAVFGKDQQPYRIAGSQTDITDQVELQEKLQHGGLYDALTGLPNRILFLERANQALIRTKQEKNWTFAVIYIGIDRFKNINEAMGHSGGDLFLKQFAEKIKGFTREGDTVARIVGDEFAIMLNGVKNQATALRYAERVTEKISSTIDVLGQTFMPKVSSGVAINTIDYQNPETLIRDAELAMRQAKETVADKAVLFVEDMRSKKTKAFKIVNSLAKALENKQIEMFYQPIISLKTMDIQGFESLMRWRHPQFGLISPTEFIPLAEDSNQIVQLGTFALRTSCQQLQNWSKKFICNQNRFMSVNVSGKQLEEPDCIDVIEYVLEETGVAPALLKIEITESVFFSSSLRAKNNLSALAKLGVNLVVDDFGTGYSSLSVIHQFPFKTLKIDQSFVKDMLKNKKSYEMVRVIQSLAEALQMKTVVEGIENNDVLSCVKEIQCDYGQGYYFSKPISAEEMERLLKVREKANKS